MSYQTPIYASDLKPELRKDSFIKGIEEAISEAEEKGAELIVGHFVEKDEWELG